MGTSREMPTPPLIQYLSNTFKYIIEGGNFSNKRIVYVLLRRIFSRTICIIRIFIFVFLCKYVAIIMQKLLFNITFVLALTRAY